MSVSGSVWWASASIIASAASSGDSLTLGVVAAITGCGAGRSVREDRTVM